MKTIKIEIELYVPKTNSPIYSYKTCHDACNDVVRKMTKICFNTPCSECVFCNKMFFNSFKQKIEIMNRGESTGFFDNTNNEIFVGDRFIFKIEGLGESNSECVVFNSEFYLKVEGQKNLFPLNLLKTSNSISIKRI